MPAKLSILRSFFIAITLLVGIVIFLTMTLLVSLGFYFLALALVVRSWFSSRTITKVPADSLPGPHDWKKDETTRLLYPEDNEASSP